ncbi:MAG: cation:proton antiporter [Candidatus Latescibacterota bacterium]|nr:MAG: cation:proton antiporter [Candidatus Latescibacterota bacterium]
MHLDIGVTPALTIAVALAAGMVAQSVARHLRIPGIVALLAAGVLLGPDGLGIVKPEGLGGALGVLVEFAVAVILFEGGLNLNWRRLRGQVPTIRLLISVGAVITAFGGTLASRLILGWSWPLSILFGTLVIVTGPTVITPLLRRIRIRRKLETILEAEGIFIDAVGAILAVVVLEVVLSPDSSSLALGAVSVPTRLVFGAVVGMAGGTVIALLLRFRGVVPEGLENVFTLALALAIYHTSNVFVPETGIVAVVVAGLAVGNIRTPALRDLREFKEQLTVLLIGMLFVLLAADVRLAEVAELGWMGVWVVLALMVLVRPINVLACTLGAGLDWKEKAFLSWLAPRGIVAAAVASLSHERLAAAGLDGGAEMRALVFMVIAITVNLQGATGSLVARWLSIRRPTGQGYVILGAHELARLIGRLLRDAGEEVVVVDASADLCRDAEKEGLRVVFGNALDERVLFAADVESRKAVVGALTNEAVNLLFARRARTDFKVPRAHVAIQRGHTSIDQEMVHEAGGTVLFGHEIDLELWSIRIRRRIASPTLWRWVPPDDTSDGKDDGPAQLPQEMQNTLLPLVVRREKAIELYDDQTKLKESDEVFWLIFSERQEEAQTWLKEGGWSLLDAGEEVDGS